jgi:hypothetical protein
MKQRPLSDRNACQFCRGKFGLVRHRHGRSAFCSKQCLQRYMQDNSEAGAKRQRWLEYLSR